MKDQAIMDGFGTPTELRPYMVDQGDWDEEGCAVLVFALRRGEAKSLGHAAIRGFDSYAEYTHIRARLMLNRPWLFKDADKEKLAANVAHVIDNPASCVVCTHWGLELNKAGKCTDCLRRAKVMVDAVAYKGAASK